MTHEERQESKAELSGIITLHDLGMRLMRQSQLPSLLSEILSAAEAITDADMGNIQLVDESGALRIQAQHGFSAEFLDFFAAVHSDDAAACGSAMSLKEQVVVEDVERSPIFDGSPALEVMLRAGARAVQSTPMIGGTGNLIGVLSTHYRKPQKPSARDLRLLSLFAREAAYLIERLRADEALRESEERYRATFETAAVGIAHVGLDGRWIRFNDALCAITGYSREELGARTFADITHPDDLEADWALARRVAAGEIPTYSMEKRYLRKDGSVVWVDLTVSLLREASGARHYISVIEDISPRKQAESEHRAAKDELQLVVDNMPAAVTRCSRDLRYVWVSRGYAALLGRTPDEIMGRPILDVMGAPGYENIRSYVERVLTGQRVEFTAEVLYAGRGWRWLHAVYVPTYAHDETVDGWIAVVTDVTEERRSAEQLRQSQRLESLGVLAGGIAHDFNNLLVGILGNAGLALDLLGPGTPARKVLEDVISASDRAAGLTRQLLAYAGKEELTMRPISISRLIRELADLLRASISKNVDLTLDIADSLPLVEADQTQLQQVIMNLVINAAEAIPENSKGAVKVTACTRKAIADDFAHAMVAAPSDNQQYVALTITDTGQGIAPEVQSRIFDPFFTTKFTGRGLGLSAVLGIIKAHRGAITLKSARGEGTTFTLLLRTTEAAAAIEPSQPARLGRGSGTVLVVDDEATIRTFVQRTLEFHGYKVVLAENGEQAIQVFTAHPEVVAIVLDLAMPVLPGDQATPHLRRINPGIPIILSTGYTEKEARTRFADLGVTNFLLKPYRPAALMEKLTASLDSRATIHQIGAGLSS